MATHRDGHYCVVRQGYSCIDGRIHSLRSSPAHTYAYPRHEIFKAGTWADARPHSTRAQDHVDTGLHFHTPTPDGPHPSAALQVNGGRGGPSCQCGWLPSCGACGW